MKSTSYLLLIVNAFLAVGLTIISLHNIRPKNCYNFCDPAYVIPCPKGSCYFGEQKAGWPIPAFVDAPGGGSPTGSWGLLGPEDPPLLIPMIADVLFYSILVWIVLYTLQFFRHRIISEKLFLSSLPVNAVLGAFLWFFFLIFTFTMGLQGIGRGYRDGVYMETSKGTDSAMGFAPTVTIPLHEVIEYYGSPDYLWFTSNNTTIGATSLLLYWDSVKMFVKLPEIEGKTYPVHRKTDIEKIIFYDDQDVISVAGQQSIGEKTAWTGYGNYQP